MVPIAEQIAEIERELRNRERFYPKSKLLPETQEQKIAAMSAALATLKVVEANANGLRQLLLHLRKSQRDAPPSPEETAALMAHPAVVELIKGFPDAVVSGIKPIERPSYSGPSDEAGADDN